MSPQLSAETPADSLPSDIEDDVRDLWLKDTRIVGLELDRPELLDLRLDGCDLSGVTMTGFIARRVALHDTRVRGVTCVKGQIDEGLFERCTTTELSFRFSRLRRVVFRDCDLSGVDFTSTVFDHVTIEGCDLQRARFDAASANCLSIRNSNLTGIFGVSGLKGARLDASDLPALAQALAREVGIEIADA